MGKAPEVPEEEPALSGTSSGSRCALDTGLEVAGSEVWPPSLTLQLCIAFTIRVQCMAQTALSGLCHLELRIRLPHMCTKLKLGDHAWSRVSLGFLRQSPSLFVPTT